MRKTFAPMAKINTMRKINALATVKGWHLDQMGMKNVYIQGQPEEVVYMMQSPDFELSKHPDTIYQLKKPIYKQKQA